MEHWLQYSTYWVAKNFIAILVTYIASDVLENKIC